jgi:DNA mismatch endonuclease (patch repair protein)
MAIGPNSAKMRAVRRKNTAPEVKLREFLRARGLRFQLHVKRLPGTPDIVLMRDRVAVFVNGCFWHRHTHCARATTPKSNVDYWTKKFAENVARDAATRIKLRTLGWRVINAWECQVRKNPETIFNKIRKIRIARLAAVRRRAATRRDSAQ